MKQLENEFDFYGCGNIAFLNGTEGMHQTESYLFRALAECNFDTIYNIDNLFEKPERLQVLVLMNIETIILGTTGVSANKLNKVFEAFEKLNYKPKNALITMGDEYFEQYAEGVNLFKLMPMFSSDQRPVIMGF